MKANAMQQQVADLCDPRLMALTAPASAVAEQFRLLHHRLDQVRIKRPMAVIGLTSALAGEGKSLTVANLAACAARRGRRTALVDCDLRRPRQAALFGIDPGPGLASLLAGRSRFEDVVRIGPSGMTLIPGGDGPDDPAGLFAGPTFNQLMEKLRASHQEVYLDLPPVLPFADALAAAALADGVLLVVRSEKTPAGLASDAVEQLAGTPLLGCVMTGCRGPEAAYRNYYARR